MAECLGGCKTGVRARQGRFSPVEVEGRRTSDVCKQWHVLGVGGRGVEWIPLSHSDDGGLSLGLWTARGGSEAGGAVPVLQVWIVCCFCVPVVVDAASVGEDEDGHAQRWRSERKEPRTAGESGRKKRREFVKSGKSGGKAGRARVRVKSKRVLRPRASTINRRSCANWYAFGLRRRPQWLVSTPGEKQHVRCTRIFALAPTQHPLNPQARRCRCDTITLNVVKTHRSAADPQTIAADGVRASAVAHVAQALAWA